MSEFHWLQIPGGCYFFTVPPVRAPVFRDEVTVAAWREVMQRVEATRPFEMEAMVLLPDHLHCLSIGGALAFFPVSMRPFAPSH